MVMGRQVRLPLVSHYFASSRDGSSVRLPQVNGANNIYAQLPPFKANILIHEYVKRGNMVKAHELFDNMPKRDVVSWNIMILGYAKQEECARALQLYKQMHHEGVQASDRTFVGVFKACGGMAALEEGKKVNGQLGKIGCLEKGRAIHYQVVKGGFELDVFLGTTLVDMYAKCASMEDARRVFDQLPHRDVVAWNAMIMGYGTHQKGVLALDLYKQMHQEDVTPDLRTFLVTLNACSCLATVEEEDQIAKIELLEKCRAVHLRVVKSGFESDVFVGTAVVDMYAKCGSMEDAQRAFDNLPHPDVVTWTTMILGYSKQGEGTIALDLYARMQQEGVTPDCQTFVGALNACSTQATLKEMKQVDGKFLKVGCLEKGRAIHSQVVKKGFELDAFVGATLVDMYTKGGCMEDARCVFDKLTDRDVVTWTTMILGYSKQEEGLLALDLYAQMEQEGIRPDHRTFVGVLNSCSGMAAPEEGKNTDGKFRKIGFLEKGRAIHSQVVKSGFDLDVYVGTTSVDMYAKCGSMEDAECVFEQLPYCNEVTWTTMILGYAEQDESEDAFRLYAQMQKQGLSPNSFTYVAILKACGNIAALGSGLELHSQIIRVGFENTPIVGTSLIDMYAKSGSMVEAQQLLNAMPMRDVVPWNALIAGYARQGESEFVFHLFEKMRDEGIEPNRVTFLSVLNVCSHVGLLDKGHNYFQAMSKQYNIAPTVEHYTCIIDLLGRAGQLDEAVTMVEKMPFQPNLVAWLSMMGACQMWKDVTVGRHAFDNAMTLDVKLPAAYVFMANIYAGHDKMRELLEYEQQ